MKKNEKNPQKSTKKLALHRETLRSLEEGTLEAVAGGISTMCTLRPTGCQVC